MRAPLSWHNTIFAKSSIFQSRTAAENSQNERIHRFQFSHSRSDAKNRDINDVYISHHKHSQTRTHSGALSSYLSGHNEIYCCSRGRRHIDDRGRELERERNRMNLITYYSEWYNIIHMHVCVYEEWQWQCRRKKIGMASGEVRK